MKLKFRWIKVFEIIEIIYLTAERLEEGEWNSRLIGAVASTIASIHGIVVQGKYCGNEHEFNSLVTIAKHILPKDVKISVITSNSFYVK